MVRGMLHQYDSLHILAEFQFSVKSDQSYIVNGQSDVIVLMDEVAVYRGVVSIILMNVAYSHAYRTVLVTTIQAVSSCQRDHLVQDRTSADPRQLDVVLFQTVYTHEYGMWEVGYMGETPPYHDRFQLPIYDTD